MSFFRYIHILYTNPLLNGKHCFPFLLSCCVFIYVSPRRVEMEKECCVSFITPKKSRKTFNFVFLDVRLIIAFQTCNREFFVWILCRFPSHATWLWGLWLCSCSCRTQYVICCFLSFVGKEKKTTWFIVFDWCTICVSFVWRMINLFQHGSA
jgi:hypothetical protein